MERFSDELPSAKELRIAARGASLMAYAAGVAGIVAGILMLREGELAFAVILWTITFAVGATLMGLATLVRSIAGLTARLSKLDRDVGLLLHDRTDRDVSPPGDWRHRATY
jgi:choline-glycine betaine transporter